jgi:hypothetical protein
VHEGPIVAAQLPPGPHRFTAAAAPIPILTPPIERPGTILLVLGDGSLACAAAGASDPMHAMAADVATIDRSRIARTYPLAAAMAIRQETSDRLTSAQRTSPQTGDPGLARRVDTIGVELDPPIRPPARFEIRGMTVEVAACPTGPPGWLARVVAPVPAGDWHWGRRAWAAVEAAAEAGVSQTG